MSFAADSDGRPVRWQVARQDQGQIVERAYAYVDGRLYRRTTDYSDRSISFEVADEDWVAERPESESAEEAGPCCPKWEVWS